MPVCAPYAAGPCPDGPRLTGAVTAMAVGGGHDLLGFSTTPNPHVTGVQPDAGPAAGGTVVTITGTNFSGATAVHFGSAEASEVEVESASEITAISPPGGGTVDVTVTNPEGVSDTSPVNQFTYQAAPTVITSAASSLGQASVTLNGTVNPNRELVSDCRFEYGTSSLYGSSVPCASLPGEGAEPVAVAASLTGLNPSTTYHFRIAVSDKDGTSYGSEQTFTTLSPDPPAVVTDAASSLGQIAATLNGTVNPEGAVVSSCRFEYGKSSPYGSSVPCASLPGEGAGPVAVSASLTGLSPGTTYHFRVAANNSDGTSYGSEQAFTTGSPELPELGRCLKRSKSKYRFSSATCTTTSSGEDSGKYEWQPWPAAKNRFSYEEDDASAWFETVGGSSFVVCPKRSATGEYTGSQTMAESIVFTGCKGSGLGGAAAKNVIAKERVPEKFAATYSKGGSGSSKMNSRKERLSSRSAGS